MQVHVINDATIQTGRNAFKAGVLNNLASSHLRERADHARGPRAVPGCIVAAMEMGFTTGPAISAVVARVTGCKPKTVRTMLEALASPSFAGRMWEASGQDRYELLVSVPQREAAFITN